VHRGADVSEVARVDDDFDVRVGGSEAAEDGDGLVQRAVVDEDVFVGISADAGHHVADLAIEFFDVVLLVVTGGDNADCLQRNLASGGDLYASRVRRDE
jgi:hypothetical protein